MNDLISIIVPVYNVEKYLRRCIDSIVAQTYKNLEIILIDDGSTDGSAAICDEYAKKDSRIVVIHKKYGGVSDARNVGVDNAKGNYLGFVDSDDYIKEDMYEYLYNNLIKYGADISVCGVIDEAEYGEFTGIPTNFYYVTEDTVFDSEKATKLLIEDKTIDSHLWDKLYRKRLFENVHFPIGKRFEDMFVAYLPMSKAEKVVLLPESKYYYVRRSSSISFTMPRLNLQHIFEAYLKRLDFVEKNHKDILDIALSKAVTAGINIYNYNLKENCYEDKTIESVTDLLQGYSFEIYNNGLIEKKFKIMTRLMITARPIYNLAYKIYSKFKG